MKGQSAAVTEARAPKPRGVSAQAWDRLSRNRLALASLALILSFYLIALLAPFLAPHDPLKQYYDNVLQRGVWATGDWRFILGTDALGRDVLSRSLYGARVSMTIGLAPVAMTLLIGGLLGLSAGWYGGFVDTILMRLADVMYAFPGLLFLIIITVTFRESWLGQELGGLPLLIAAVSFVGWEGMARLVRGQVLTVRDQEYVLAARIAGASTWRIMTRHIAPNILAPVIVFVAFSIPGTMLAEAGLSFLGIGVRPPMPSWGTMIAEGQPTLLSQPALTIAPALCIAILMLAFAALGDGIRDALDPQLD
jgi:oligopeptide transport system permease protein